jgi:hypothetical protein
LRLSLNGGLVFEHDRDIVAYRVDTLALDTLQPATIFFKDHLGLANGTDQDFEQIFAQRHASHFNSVG